MLRNGCTGSLKSPYSSTALPVCFHIYAASVSMYLRWFSVYVPALILHTLIFLKFRRKFLHFSMYLTGWRKILHFSIQLTGWRKSTGRFLWKNEWFFQNPEADILLSDITPYFPTNASIFLSYTDSFLSARDWKFLHFKKQVHIWRKLLQFWKHVNIWRIPGQCIWPFIRLRDTGFRKNCMHLPQTRAAACKVHCSRKGLVQSFLQNMRLMRSSVIFDSQVQNYV